MPVAYEIKRLSEDFIVEEITPDKKVLTVGKKYKFDEKSTGDQLVCVLEKKNWDTHLAVRKIAERLHISPKRIGFAGTKDKRAVTTQRVSLWNIKPSVTDFLKIKDITLKPLYYSDRRVELGDLRGNRFTIRVYSRKNLGAVPKRVPNFFGEQRFGSGGRQVTHLVGNEIVRGNLKKAVDTYLTKTSQKEKDEVRKARRKLGRGKNYEKALAYFPAYLKYERTLLACLAENPADYAGALRRLPKFLKLMFVHAYQAWLFNKFLEKALKRKTRQKDGPIFGYESPPLNELEESILKKEGIRPQDFLVKSLPECSSRGERRPLFVKPVGFKVLKTGKGFCVLRFSLPKGCYATTVVDYLFSSQARKASNS